MMRRAVCSANPQHNKSFERDASIACFSCSFLKIRLNACARRGSIQALDLRVVCKKLRGSYDFQ